MRQGAIQAQGFIAAGVGLQWRARAIQRQCQRRSGLCVAGQPVGPIGLLLALGLQAELLVNKVLIGQVLWPSRRSSFRVRGVGKRPVGKQHREGPAVADDVVRIENDGVLLLTPAQHPCAPQRRNAQVQCCAGFMCGQFFQGFFCFAFVQFTQAVVRQNHIHASVDELHFAVGCNACA